MDAPPNVILNQDFVYVANGHVLSPSMVEEMRARLIWLKGRLAIIEDVRERRWQALSVETGISEPEPEPRMREYGAPKRGRRKGIPLSPEQREALQITNFLLKGVAVSKEKGMCLNPVHKDRKEANRGLCQTCYKAASELVKAGKLTWEKLEKMGKAKPAGKPFPKSSEVKAWLLLEDEASLQENLANSPMAATLR